MFLFMPFAKGAYHCTFNVGRWLSNVVELRISAVYGLSVLQAVDSRVVKLLSSLRVRVSM